MREEEATYRVLIRRALAGEDPTHIQVQFARTVLDRYLEANGVSVVRTDTVGRIKKDGSWSLDFGIAPLEDALHVSFGELLRLPEAEREHWAQQAIVASSSKMFLQMRLAPASCFDDGELRPWQ